MIQLGKINLLEIKRFVSFGLYLGDDEDEVLLPIKYHQREYEEGEKIPVFVYLDNEGRGIATTLTPKITLNSFAVLTAREVNDFGAFFEMGIEKDLFVPFKEQREKVQAGDSYLVYMYIDDKTERLVGTTKINKFLNPDTSELQENQKVNVLVFAENQLGYSVIVDNQFRGMLYHNELLQKPTIGEMYETYISAIRPDGKIDVRQQKSGTQAVDENVEKLRELLEKKGFVTLTDNSTPEEIYEQLKMSKKAFKKAVGNLYKNREILIEDNGIRLTAND